LKKPSAASTPKPLESYTLFVEENLGKRLAGALREQGLTVVTHVDNPEVPRGIDDSVWAAKVGQEGWVALTKDNDTRYKPNERIAIVRAKARVIQLTRGPWTSDQMIEAVTLAKRRLRMLLHRNPGPFIARVNKKGEITQLFKEADLTGPDDPEPTP